MLGASLQGAELEAEDFLKLLLIAPILFPLALYATYLVVIKGE